MKNPNNHRFTHCPACGCQALDPDSMKSFRCRACGFIFFINCAAAVMAVILDKTNRLLVTRRKYPPAQGTLDLPGGFADPGEGIEQALAREIKEELNLEVADLSYLCSFPSTYTYKTVVYPVTDMAFACQVKSLSPITAQDDIDGFEFLSLDRVAPGRFGLESPRQVIRYLKKRR